MWPFSEELSCEHSHCHNASATMKRLKWNGNIEAQRQHEEAASKLKPKKTRKRKRKVKPTRLGWVCYKDYLQSDWWKQRRLRSLRLAGFRCQRCGSDAMLQVHHLNYKRLGRERDADLEALCRQCHERIHQHEITATEHLCAIHRP